MCELCGFFKTDKPFRFHQPDSKTKEVLIGTIAKKYIEEFENSFYPHAMNNSLMTAVIGQPGVGKTQLVNYLENRPLDEKDRISLILELKDTRLSYDDLRNFICINKSVKNYLELHGCKLPSEEKPTKQIININKAIEKIFIQTKNSDVGVCLLVDAVDEYIRKRNSLDGNIRSEIIQDLLGTFMYLLNDLSRLCVVFAVTTDVYEELKEELKEVSSGRRFKFIPDENGNLLILERLDSDETLEMIAKYLDLWSQRNNLNLPLSQETLSDDNFNIFPFTPEAINLFWRAGAVPGDTCMGCLMALFKKILRSNNNENYDHLVVTKSDAAWTIKEFSGYFLNYEIETELKQEIDYLLNGKELDFQLEKISTKAMQINSDYSDIIIDAFESFILGLSNDFNNYMGNKHIFIKNRFKRGTDSEILDLIIKYKSKNIGLQFVLTKSIREIRNKINALATALKNKQIKKGFIIVISENQIEILNLINNCMNDLKSNFEDILYNLDYFPTIHKITIDENNAWNMVGLHEIIKGDKNSMRKYCEHLNQKLHLSSEFFELNQVNPIYIKSIHKSTTVGTIDRAE